MGRAPPLTLIFRNKVRGTYRNNGQKRGGTGTLHAKFGRFVPTLHPNGLPVALHRQIRSTGSYNVDLNSSKLYLDDVQDILSAVEEFAKEYCQQSDERDKDWEITLQAGKATADSVEDLREATREELARLSIHLTKPRVAIDLWRHVASITTDNHDLEARALADDITAFVHTKKSWTIGIERAFRYPLLVWVVALVSLAYAATHSEHNHPDYTDYYWSAGFLALGILAFVGEITVRRMLGIDGVLIIASRRNEKQHISGRARRDIVIAIGTAVISAIIIGVAGLWAGVFAK
jgi:hypothetical protein